MKMCTYETFFKLTVEIGQSSSLLSTLMHKKRHGLKRIAGVLITGRRILRRALSAGQTLSAIEELIVRGPRSSSFWLPRNLSNHRDRQARARDIVLVKSRERSQTLQW
jgi:hypothetical protein